MVGNTVKQNSPSLWTVIAHEDICEQNDAESLG